jgi:hypothetical protein
MFIGKFFFFPSPFFKQQLIALARFLPSQGASHAETCRILFYFYHFFLSFMKLLLATLTSFSPLAIASRVTLGMLLSSIGSMSSFFCKHQLIKQL